MSDGSDNLNSLEDVKECFLFSEMLFVVVSRLLMYKLLIIKQGDDFVSSICCYGSLGYGCFSPVTELVHFEPLSDAHIRDSNRVNGALIIIPVGP